MRFVGDAGRPAFRGRRTTGVASLEPPFLARADTFQRQLVVHHRTDQVELDRILAVPVALGRGNLVAVSIAEVVGLHIEGAAVVPVQSIVSFYSTKPITKHVHRVVTNVAISSLRLAIR